MSATYSRQADGTWVLRELGAGGALPLASLAIRLEVDEIYRGVFDLPA